MNKPTGTVRIALLTLLCTIPAGIGPTAVAAQEAEQEATGESIEAPAPEASTDIPAPPRFLSGLQATIEDYAGDVFYWGQGVSVTGTLGDNVFAGGSLLSLDGGRIEGDFFAFGASVTIDGEVLGDVYAFSSDVRVSPGAVIHGNLTAFTGSLRVAGTVRGHLRGGGGGTVITGTVGPVDIEAGTLTLAETAVVRGDLQYKSNEEAEIAEGADVQGEIRRSRDGDGENEEETDDGGIGLWDIGWTLWSFLSAFLVGAVLLLVGGRVARRPAISLRDSPASGLGFGFVVAVVFPVSCLVAIVLLVTLPLGLIGLVVFALLLYLARLVAAQFLGAWLLTRLTGDPQPSEYLSLAIGLALLMLIGVVPYLGFLLHLIALIVGLGGIYLALRHFGFPATGSSRPTTAADPAPEPS